MEPQLPQMSQPIADAHEVVRVLRHRLARESLLLNEPFPRERMTMIADALAIASAALSAAQIATTGEIPASDAASIARAVHAFELCH